MYVSDKKNRQGKQIKQCFSFGTRLFFSRGGGEERDDFVDCRMFSSISGPYTLDASSIPQLRQPKGLQTLPNSSGVLAKF